MTGHYTLFSDLNVSRETYDALKAYQRLLEKWTTRINLISKSTHEDVWVRHICDSAQVMGLASKHAAHWIDIGSWGGLPGLVVAILAKELNPKLRVTLIESDQRKAVFLRTVVRELQLNAMVQAFGKLIKSYKFDGFVGMGQIVHGTDNGESVYIYGTYSDLNAAFNFGPQSKNDAAAFAEFSKALDNANYLKSFTSNKCTKD